MFAKLFELRDKKLKENKKKGFTLVELIVVLVILAILAALLIPTLTGYINKAKEKSIIAETRQVVMAAQTIADEQYGTISLTGSDTVKVELGDTTGYRAAGSDESGAPIAAAITIKKQDIADLAEVNVNNITSVEGKGGKISKVVYESDGKTCTYTAGSNGSKGTYVVK